MPTVTAFQAKTRFGEPLDRVVSGEEIVTTRREKAVARPVPKGGANLEHTREAVAELRAGGSLIARPRSDTACQREADCLWSAYGQPIIQAEVVPA